MTKAPRQPLHHEEEGIEPSIFSQAEVAVALNASPHSRHALVKRAFFSGVERLVDQSGKVFFMASPAKALADYVYVQKPEWNELADAAESLRIEPDDLASVTRDQIDELSDNHFNCRVQRFLESWQKGLST